MRRRIRIRFQYNYSGSKEAKKFRIRIHNTGLIFRFENEKKPSTSFTRQILLLVFGSKRPGSGSAFKKSLQPNSDPHLKVPMQGAATVRYLTNSSHRWENGPWPKSWQRPAKQNIKFKQYLITERQNHEKTMQNYRTFLSSYRTVRTKPPML
jgi:hypothetical protein